MELVIFMGVQATGKSTFYKQRFMDTHIRLNSATTVFPPFVFWAMTSRL